MLYIYIYGIILSFFLTTILADNQIAVILIELILNERL